MNSGHPLSRREPTVRSEDLSGEIQGESEESQPAEPTDDAKAWRDFFWSIKVTSSIVITMNLEFNSACRRRKHSLFHSNTLILQGLLSHIWMCCKSGENKNIGMWTRIEVCQIHGKESQVHFERKTCQGILCGPAERLTKFKQLPDLRMCGPKYGEKQEEANEKPKLDNPRRTRGISFIDPEDEENEETIKNAKPSSVQETEAKR